jgi:hypothetical protein
VVRAHESGLSILRRSDVGKWRDETDERQGERDASKAHVELFVQGLSAR